MQKVLLVGGGKGGLAILKTLAESSVFHVCGVVDIDEQSPGIQYAKQHDLPHGENWRDFLSDSIDIVIEVTGKQKVFEEIRESRSKNTVLVPGSVANLITKLLGEKEGLIQQLESESKKRDLIFNSIEEGMIGIDPNGEVIFFNASAEKITGVQTKYAMGKKIADIIPESRLMTMFESRRAEINQELTLTNGIKIITSRIPLQDESGRVIGAFAVFKEKTDILHLAEEVTNLQEIRTLLSAIIQSSDDAISVVDEEGRGLLINPAYTRITGLTEEEVVGKPATADISEGESIHLKVLQTRRSIRGQKLSVGPNEKEVIVNVAPIIVNGQLKGSVGVIHDMSEIQSLTRDLDRARRIIRTLEARYTFEDIIGNSEELTLAVEQAKLGSKTPAPVLLRGEIGTGKELFAHAIHNTSKRKFNKFLRVQIASIPYDKLEIELFGQVEEEKNGHTINRKKGLFEEAQNGSIFLDDIGDLPPNIQSKLLRILQDRELIRVGTTKPIPIDVRVIAATNMNLERAIASGDFREDLYYRLNRMPIQIPPIRKRIEDLPSLCNHFIQKINQDYGRNVEGITEEALNHIKDHDWPGNLRELENVLSRAMIFMDYQETIIKLEHLPNLKLDSHHANKEREDSEQRDLTKLVDGFEKDVIAYTLCKHDGNKTATARALNISVRNLYYKLEKYGIDTGG
ncbi:sigma 54-interacting transcriptional regulator [Bacillus spongiae]|uniref:Sigma 54-interacting transcriptional regulator n=1 Tax=Bacillus spongiae TaxID=2683610 RepID=A0ABU8HG52_9BACI